jgi:mannose-6-phosphate isomerase-like protein (cupin superfamily)
MQKAATLRGMMSETTTQQRWSAQAMEARVVRYTDLRPCYNAFIDTRTPGSEAKENFTIIGPGVSENPDQYVHIAEPHGFNIGGARQPPGCVNSQHSHDTAESFVAYSGTWRFDLGEHGDDAQVILHPGDVISIPTRTFRGFTNIGEGTEPGFLFGLLGQDNPGRVTWAPQVFDMARDYGLVLLEDGQLIDTAKGQTLPLGKRPMPPTSAEQVAALTRYTQAEAEALVVRAADAPTNIIGDGAPLGWDHGYTLDRLVDPNDTATNDRPEVLFIHEGEVSVAWADGALSLNAGDTMTVPVGVERRLSGRAVMYRVRRAD